MLIIFLLPIFFWFIFVTSMENGNLQWEYLRISIQNKNDDDDFDDETSLNVCENACVGIKFDKVSFPLQTQHFVFMQQAAFGWGNFNIGFKSLTFVLKAFFETRKIFETSSLNKKEKMHDIEDLKIERMTFKSSERR